MMQLCSLSQKHIRLLLPMNCMSLLLKLAVEQYYHNYVLVSDTIFLLKTWLMKLYPGKGLLESKEIFNYRLSHCRRMVWNFSCKMENFQKINPSIVESIIKACVCLHNYFKLTYNSQYVPDEFVDLENSTGNLVPGDCMEEDYGRWFNAEHFKKWFK